MAFKNRRQKRSCAFVGLIAAVTLTASACGSSTGSSSSPTTAGSAGTGAPQNPASSTSTPFKVGVVTQQTVVASQANSTVLPTVNAWAKYTNAHGGINGHPISLDVQNDPGNPGVALAGVQKLVSDGVVTIISTDVGGGDASWAPYVAQQQIPVYTIMFPSATLLKSPLTFSTAPSPAFVGDIVTLAARKVNSTKIGVIVCAEAPTCSQLTAPIEAASKTNGTEVVTSLKASSTLPSYTAQCLALQSAGAQVMFPGFSAGVDRQIAANCAQQNYLPHVVNLDEGLGPPEAANPGMEGMVGMLANYPWFLANTPASKTMHNALNQYAPGLYNNANFTGEVTQLWTIGLLITAGAGAGGVGSASPISPSAQIAGMYKLHQTDLGGMTPTLTFTPGQSQAAQANCWYYVSVKNKQFTTPFGVTPTCAPNPS